MTRIIVVGAGIVGAALAYEAVKAGASVTLIDRGAVSELGASRWGFGGVNWASATTPATIEFSHRGFLRYLGLDAELKTPSGFRPGNALILIRDGDEWTRSAATAAEWTDRGHEARLIERAELERLEPSLSFKGWLGAMLLAQGHLDLRRCARAMVGQAASHGLRLLDGVEVTEIKGDGAQLETSAGRLAADIVFLAAGAWTRPLLRRAGYDLPVFHSHAEFLYSEPVAPFLVHQLSWGNKNRNQAEDAAMAGPLIEQWRGEANSELVPHSQEIGLVQFEDGHVRIGQASRMVPAYRQEADQCTRDLLLVAARGLLPSVDSLPGLTLGCRPVSFTPDHLPIVGPLPGMPRAVVVATSTSPTVMAPAIGQALATYAVSGQLAPLLREWSLDRSALVKFTAALQGQAAVVREAVR